MSGDEDRDRAMADRLRSAADASGFVPFDRFMDIALYAEGLGFYARAGPTLGPRGDFYTAAHVHPLFARSIGRRLTAVREALGVERPFSVVEVGPGDGTLADGVIRTIGTAAENGGPIDYVLVERSGPLRSLALERARTAGTASGVSVRTSAGLSADGPFSGAVLANEVLDAQPARRLRWTGSAWVELGARWEGGRLVPAEARLSRALSGMPLTPAPPPGTVVEVSPSAEAMVREVADHLARGLFVVLDYGMEETELRSAHPSGTLAAVRRHRAVSDPFGAPGSRDLSVFVNFTRIRQAGRSSGLVELDFGRQAEALGRWGFPALLESELRAARSPEEEVRTRLATKNLLFGFDRFQVLELAAAESADALSRLRPEDPTPGR
ncbi:MAG TPA: SAM-dependent methyltransferase [Thermoplasmata archaeon]|nr:SAM-dependent methyltransferase [Thermoplasmata archaeon]